MNLDNTGLRLVVKGANVRHRSCPSYGTVKKTEGDTYLESGTVKKVSRGSCLVQWQGHQFAKPHYCNELEVL